MEFLTILTAICTALFGLLGFYLLFKATHLPISNKLLGLFFLLWAINFLDGALMMSGFYLRFPYLAFLEEPNVFLYGPLIYFYSRSITRQRLAWKPVYLFHLLPFFLLTVILFFSFHLKSYEFKLELVTSIYSFRQPTTLIAPVIIIFIHIFSYVFFAKRTIKKYHQSLGDYYSSISTVWLDKTLNFLIAILILSFINSFFQAFGNEILIKIGMISMIIMLLVFIAQVYLKALDQPRIFLVGDRTENPPVNSLTKEEKEDIFRKIKTSMELEKNFLNPELTVDDLAKNIGINPRKVSQAINELYKQNFFDMVNTYRIDFAGSIIKNNKDKGLTFLEVMYASGFNSKSSFNTQFKKKTGLTPSEFKRLHS